MSRDKKGSKKTNVKKLSSRSRNSLFCQPLNVMSLIWKTILFGWLLGLLIYFNLLIGMLVQATQEQVTMRLWTWNQIDPQYHPFFSHLNRTIEIWSVSCSDQEHTVAQVEQWNPR
jgi:hypothetical protein